MHALYGYDFTHQSLLQRGYTDNLSTPNYSIGVIGYREGSRIAHRCSSNRSALTKRTYGVKFVPENYWLNPSATIGHRAANSVFAASKSVAIESFLYELDDIEYIAKGIGEWAKTNLFNRCAISYCDMMFLDPDSTPPGVLVRSIDSQLHNFFDRHAVANLPTPSNGQSLITLDIEEVNAAEEAIMYAALEQDALVSNMRLRTNADDNSKPNPKYTRLGINSQNDLLHFLRKSFTNGIVNTSTRCINARERLNVSDIGKAKDLGSRVMGFIKFVMLKCTKKKAHILKKEGTLNFWENPAFDMRVIFDVNWLDNLYYGSSLINIRGRSVSRILYN